MTIILKNAPDQVFVAPVLYGTGVRGEGDRPGRMKGGHTPGRCPGVQVIQGEALHDGVDTGGDEDIKRRSIPCNRLSSPYRSFFSGWISLL
jgi:hypothetical protein